MFRRLVGDGEFVGTGLQQNMNFMKIIQAHTPSTLLLYEVYNREVSGSWRAAAFTPTPPIPAPALLNLFLGMHACPLGVAGFAGWARAAGAS